MVIAIIAILSFLVLIHEWGHYIAAKKTGVRVEEFGFGYPPRLFLLFKRKETEFTLNALPFGGFVRLAGDDAETLEKGTEAQEESGTPPNQLFSNKSKFQRLIVIYAGAFMNILFGVVAFAAIYTQIGIPELRPHPLITGIVQDSPASEVGIQAGDEVLRFDEEQIDSSVELITLLQENQGERIELVVKRGDEQLTMRPYVRRKEEIPKDQGSIGILLSDTELIQYHFWQRPFRGIVQGIKDSIMFAVVILDTLGNMVAQFVQSGKIPEELSGPIGIVDTVSKEKLLSQGWVVGLNLAVLISINLGVMNLEIGLL